MEKTDNKEYLWYGLYAFAGFGLELVLQMFEGMLGLEDGVFSHCLHLGLTSLLWGMMSFLLYQSSKRKLKFNIMNGNLVTEGFTENSQGRISILKKQNIIIVLLLMLAALVCKFFVVGGVKLLMEYNNLGLIRFIFQYIYYIFEVMLIILSIAFGQKFFEEVVKKSDVIIPFGGLFLACTWGLMHILTQDFATGIYAFGMAVVYGMVYVLLNKNAGYAYLLNLILFIV